jgi:DNA polymerase-3 subunit beta
MKATILLENLQRNLSFVNHAISSKSSMPSLLNFLLKTKGGYLEAQATDLEIGILSKIPCKTEGEGDVSIAAKTFLDLVGSLTGDKVTLETKDNILSLSAQSVKTTFPIAPAQDFPTLFEKKGEKVGSLEKETLDNELSRIVFSASVDMGRPSLSGVLIKKEEKGLTLVATDGFRLSLKKNLGVSLSQKIDASIIVPARLLREVVSFKPEEEKLDMYISKEANQVIFEDSRTTLVGRLIDSEYPDYEKILPADFSLRCLFDKDEAQNAVRVCAIFAREAANIIKLSIEKDKIVFSASAPSVGENSVEVAAKVEGEENQIAFNARYLLDFFGSISEESVSFEMSGPLSPGVFKSPKDPDYLHLIMPIRIQE